jgi:hypothetical protein
MINFKLIFKFFIKILNYTYNLFLLKHDFILKEIIKILMTKFIN